MMSEWQILAAIFAVGIASYTMRAGGYLAASVLPQSGVLPRLLRFASGNLFISFVAVGICEGGWPSFFGCLGAVTTIIVTKLDWAALGIGFAVAALFSAVQ